MTARAALGSAAGNQRGILLMVLGMALFAVEDAFIKVAMAGLPPGEVLLVLGAAGGATFALAARARGLRLLSRRALHPAVLGRNACEMVGTLGYVLALAAVPLTTASAIFQAVPLFVTMGAALFLGESVGWRRWTAILLGFAGVIVIIRPGAESFQPGALWALLAAFGLAARDLFTRRIPAGTDSLLLAGWGLWAVAALGAGQLLASGGGRMPEGAEWAWLLGAWAFGTTAYWTLTEATRAGELSAVMPFRYTRLLFALLLGALVFAERPDLWTIVGASAVIASGLYSFARERARALSMRRPGS